MEPKAVFPLFFFLILSVGHLSAQTSSTSSSIAINDFEIANVADTDMEWAFLEDAEDQKVYIDFAELGGNFSELIIQDADGRAIFKEDLFDVPSDSIYELDLSSLDKGEYTIELKTYSRPIFKAVSVK